MRKNTAGQYIAFQAISKTDGSDVTTGSPSVYYTIDGGTQATTNSSAIHEGNGQWSVALTQAETNGDHIVYTFVLTNAVSQTLNVYTVNADLTNIDAAISTRSTFDPASDTVANVTTVGSVTGAVGSVTAAVTTDSASRTASQADVSALATSAALATAQADLDTLTGTDGVTLATSQPNYAPNTTTPPTAAAVADAVWDEAYSGHTTAGTFGKLMDVLRKANLSVDGTVAGTPTASAFDTNLTDADGAHDHQLLLFVSGSLAGYSSPIDTYVLSSGRITLQEALTAAPSASDEFVILPQHVHPIDEIQSGLATASALSTVDSKIDTIDGIVDAILLDTGTDGVVLSTATLQSIADEILKRDVDNVEATANEHTLATIILAILESSRSSTTWTIKRTDGSTTHATKTLTLDATADPVTGVT